MKQCTIFDMCRVHMHELKLSQEAEIFAMEKYRKSEEKKKKRIEYTQVLVVCCLGFNNK